METKIISKNKNPFLEREEFVVEVKQDVTPSKEEAIKVIGGNEDTTVIKKIHSNFGTNNFLIEAKVYDSVQAKEKIETIPQKVRKKMEADRIAEETAKKKAEEEAKAKEEAEKKEREANQEESKEESEETPVEEDEKEVSTNEEVKEEAPKE